MKALSTITKKQWTKAGLITAAVLITVFGVVQFAKGKKLPKAKGLGKKGKKVILDNFDWDSISLKLEMYLKSLCN